MVIVTGKEPIFRKTKNTLVTLLLINGKERGPKIMPMETNMLEIGYLIYLMAKVIIITILMKNILVHSKMERGMVKVFINLKMVIHMRGNGQMARDKVKVNLHGKQNRYIMENGKMIKCMEWDFFLIKMRAVI